MLNDPAYQSATVLATGRNFGCGSSREHAPWALGEYGFRCIIAPSFADIFYNNCFQNGLLPVRLPDEDVRRIIDLAIANPGYEPERGPGGPAGVDRRRGDFSAV